ncbi:hypothetical protein SODALDRAFT_331761 [Sodiomyces alkalinus F11]|uniref:Uncharacterized protein n=1 Tax=Sodiomyces alkalinus (strain CBS 110278 / VKM F-3762 / F11) TaxID=1314773 RepID=A0A3N2PYQ4_SODAK|nr:hypothetical protein SODALDRAFT_331761 [Sodiomyces alkalinus F11]ROT39650.1 hypothetical protein SODALDRAFT_331761 [Sodiomyces alkalinus F11]
MTSRQRDRKSETTHCSNGTSPDLAGQYATIGTSTNSRPTSRHPLAAKGLMSPPSTALTC